MPLVIYGLGGIHTHAYIPAMKVISGLKTCTTCMYIAQFIVEGNMTLG